MIPRYKSPRYKALLAFDTLSPAIQATAPRVIAMLRAGPVTAQQAVRILGVSRGTFQRCLVFIRECLSIDLRVSRPRGGNGNAGQFKQGSYSLAPEARRRIELAEALTVADIAAELGTTSALALALEAVASRVDRANEDGRLELKGVRDAAGVTI